MDLFLFWLLLLLNIWISLSTSFMTHRVFFLHFSHTLSNTLKLLLLSFATVLARVMYLYLLKYLNNYVWSGMKQTLFFIAEQWCLFTSGYAFPQALAVWMDIYASERLKIGMRYFHRHNCHTISIFVYIYSHSMWHASELFGKCYVIKVTNTRTCIACMWMSYRICKEMSVCVYVYSLHEFS